MTKILNKESLTPTITKMVVEAPLVAKKAEPGQFIILRAGKDGERIPLTIADFDREKGTVTIIYQVLGASTMELNALNEGQYIADFVGPLGTPSKLENLKNVAVIGGGVGSAIAYPLAKKLCSNLSTTLNTLNRGVKESKNFYVLRKTKMPALLIEIDFLSNQEIENLCSKEDYIKKVAHTIASTLLGF